MKGLFLAFGSSSVRLPICPLTAKGTNYVFVRTGLSGRAGRNGAAMAAPGSGSSPWRRRDGGGLRPIVLRSGDGGSQEAQPRFAHGALVHEA